MRGPYPETAWARRGEIGAGRVYPNIITKESQ